MITFPTSFFKAMGHRPYLSSRVVTSGQTISGVVQVTSTTGGGLWIYELSDAKLWTREKLLMWRAFEALLDGGATEVIVPLCDLRQAPVPLLFNGQPDYGAVGVTFDDGMTFGDGEGFDAPLIVAHLTSDAPLRATQVSFQIDLGGQVLAGMHFSLDHPTKGRRMYRIGQVISDNGTGGYTASVRPPLRDVIASGQPVDFEAPSCTMRLINSDSMPPVVDRHKFAAGNVSFIEAP